MATHYRGPVRIDSYNVENLFNRARVLDQASWSAGRPALEAYEKLSELLEEPAYPDEIKAGILRLLDRLDLLHSDSARFARLRQNRGRLLKRRRSGEVEIVAGGRVTGSAGSSSPPSGSTSWPSSTPPG
jgi:hypothetical protein